MTQRVGWARGMGRIGGVWRQKRSKKNGLYTKRTPQAEAASSSMSRSCYLVFTRSVPGKQNQDSLIYASANSVHAKLIDPSPGKALSQPENRGR